MALSALPSRTSCQSWADFVDEVSSTPRGSETEASFKEDMCPGVMATQPDTMSDLPSMGSASHMLGRCKPCAFFHTKGCNNAKECEFCHLCPPHEKQRRKRLRDRMYEKLGQMNADGRYNMEGKRFGHRRQISGASTVSTQSGCSRWLSHSRQSSGSSGTVSATDSTGMVPYYQFTHAMMPAIMVDSGDFAKDKDASDGYCVAAESKLERSEEHCNEVVVDDMIVRIALEQAVPSPNARGLKVNSAVPHAPCDTESTPTTSQFMHCAGVAQAAHGSIPPGSNVVLVPIPIPMPMENQCHQNTMNFNAPYVYHTEQYPAQFASLHGSHRQWFVQAAPHLAQPTYNNAASEW